MDYSDKMINRLKRIEGQARGVIRMMEEGKSCKEVVHQLTAIRTAIDRATAYIVGNNMKECLREQIIEGQDNEDVIQEAIDLLTRSR